MTDLAEPINAVIDGNNYAIYSEVVEGAVDIAFKRVRDEPLSRSARGAIPVLWEDGFAGGMGYGRAVKGGPGDAYAHTVGFDNHLPGLMRLHGRRIAVTPDSPPVDAKTDFFEAPPGGLGVFNVGNFVVSGSPQNVTHGLSVAPEAILFWTTSNITANDGTVGTGTTIACMGMTDGTTERVVAWQSDDNQATSNANRNYVSASIIAEGIAFEGNISSIGTSTFTVTWTGGTPTNAIIHFMAIGGADVQADVTEWTMPGTTAEVSVTNVGFEPDLCIHLSSRSAAVDGGSETDADFRWGMMDKNGNDWANSIYSQDNVGTSNTKRTGDLTRCLSGSAGNISTLSMRSMDSDGFAVLAINGGGDGAMLVATLSLKGVQAQVGSFTKRTTTGNQAAVSLSFTSTAFMLSSVASTTSQQAEQDHGAIAIGAATGTGAGEGEAMAWTDEDAQGTTDTYSVSDTDLAFEMLDHTDGSEDSTAEPADADMNQAGWLNWTAASGSAEHIYYLALAANPEAENFVYGANGQRTTKMSISSNVITVEEQVNHNGDAACGYGDEFEGVRYLPLGKIANAVKLTAVTSSTGDTWSDAGHTAVAYIRQQDGPDAKLAKAYSASAITIANLVALSSDGSSFAGGWEIGDLTADIVRMADTGTSFFIGKKDNLYRADPTKISEKITSETDTDDAHGTGTVAVHGTDTCLYNHGAGEFFFTGGHRPDDVGIDVNPFNQPIENITHEPVTGTYFESALHGDWKYNLYRVTESSTTKTYVLASHWIRQLGKWIPHSYDRLDGWARGMFIDKSFRLWTAYSGDYIYYQLGKDGSPDAGRDNIGFGAASTTYYHYLPEIDAGLEVTSKRLWQFFVLTRNIDSTCPVQLIVHRDEGAEESVGATITSSGLSKRYWTDGTNDTATRFRGGVKIATTAGYTPASADPQVLVLGMRVKSQADTAGAYDIMIDTGAAYEGDEPQVTQEAKDIRDALLALVNGDAVAVTDPQGNSLTLWFLDVSDFLMRGPNEDGKVHYIIRCQAEERTTPS